MNKFTTLVLASESPRRRKLLSEAGYPYVLFPVKVSEYLEKNLTIDEQIKSIARRKASVAFKQYNPSEKGDFLVLTADTMVILDDQAVGKPDNVEDAKQWLRRLSGRSHLVKTAVCLTFGRCLNLIQGQSESELVEQIEGIETSTVFFQKLSEKEISDYVLTGEPMDKAGSYGIQGLGAKFVERIEGPYDNVVGLPMELFEKMLLAKNWKLK